MLIHPPLSFIYTHHVAALVESLPLGELDNIAVFVAAALADTVVGRIIPSAYTLDKLIQQSL